MKLIQYIIFLFVLTQGLSTFLAERRAADMAELSISERLCESECNDTHDESDDSGENSLGKKSHQYLEPKPNDLKTPSLSELAGAIIITPKVIYRSTDWVISEDIQTAKKPIAMLEWLVLSKRKLDPVLS